MTIFNKDLFYGSEYVSYDNKFVARFKYVKSNRAGFLSFLTKNFTVEEYFGRLADGESPSAILESKGYIPSHIKKHLKRLGYPVTQAGFTQLVEDNVAKSQQRLSA